MTSFVRSLGIALALAVCWVTAAAAADEALFYEITVTNPGTRSQGWHGVLFDPAGHEVAAGPSQSWSTNAGDFVSVPCAQLWDPCGVIEADQLGWMKANGGNFIMDSGSWSYRLYVTAQCTRSEGWRGAVLHNGIPVKSWSGKLKTPMGPYIRKRSPHLWGQSGWFHKAWPSSVIAPGHWPCNAPH